MSYRCPTCGSSNTYYRVSKGEYVCRRCGTTWAAEKAKRGAGEG